MLRVIIMALVLAPALSATGFPVFEVRHSPRPQTELFSWLQALQPRDTQGFPSPGNPQGNARPTPPDLPGPGRRAELGQDSKARPSSDYAERKVPEDVREINGWFGRGFGISIYGGLYPILVGAGAGIELAMPVHQRVSIVARASLAASLQFEGQVYDLGARVYFDRRKNFSWYTDLTFRVAYGRAVDNWGSTLDEPVRTWGLGGCANAGFEIGSRRVRFFLELTINAVDFARVRGDLLLHWGSNLGLRIYVG